MAAASRLALPLATSTDSLLIFRFHRRGNMRHRSFISSSFAVIAALASFWPVVAAAQIKEERSWCSDRQGISAEIRIQSCTAVIERGGDSSKQQAINFKSRGIAYFQKQDYDRAVQDFNQAIKLNSRYSTAFHQRCWTLAAINRLDDALKDCTEALRLRPQFVPTLNSLGIVYLRLGRFDDAIATYNAGLQIDPKSAYALYGRGTAKLRKGDRAGGEADLAASKSIKDVAAEMTGYGVK